MTLAYLQGFNAALTGEYINPYDSHKQAAEFMQYHNGHNTGSWYNRALINP